MINYSRKEVVMENLSNYVKKNLKMSLSNFLYGYLNDMVYVRSYHVDSYWRKKREITILYLRVLRYSLLFTKITLFQRTN